MADIIRPTHGQHPKSAAKTRTAVSVLCKAGMSTPKQLGEFCGALEVQICMKSKVCSDIHLQCIEIGPPPPTVLVQ